MNAVEIRVPATSGNLGPGFDAFGIALNIYLTVRAGLQGAQRVVPTGEGADDVPTGEDNLLWRALVSYCRRFDVDVPQVTLYAHNAIPLQRGMGSSSAAAVAGVGLGRALTQAGGRDRDLIDLAAKLEGHPDNAAPAILGGLVVCHDGTVTRFEPADRLRPILCVSSTRQSTTSARSVLPETIGLHEAAANTARAAVVLAGLAGAMTFDPSGMRDVFHEPARFAIMTASAGLIRTLRAAGIAACLSGAGPSVLAVTEASDRTALGVIHDAADKEFNVRVARWDRAGATVRRLA